MKKKKWEIKIQETKLENENEEFKKEIKIKFENGKCLAKWDMISLKNVGIT